MDTSPHQSDFVAANGIRLHYLDLGGNGPATRRNNLPKVLNLREVISPGESLRKPG